MALVSLHPIREDHHITGEPRLWQDDGGVVIGSAALQRRKPSL